MTLPPSPSAPRLKALAAGLTAASLAALLALAPLRAQAWELAGPHAVLLQARDGSRMQLGTVTVAPAGKGRSAFTLVVKPARFKDFSCR